MNLGNFLSVGRAAVARRLLGVICGWAEERLL